MGITQDNKIKIIVSYKKKLPKISVLKNDVIIPIQTGRAIADEVFDEMIGDDTGDNISVQNPKYNELTAQYWVWKHYEEIGNPEYIGFMHNRRQFIFDKELKHLPVTWLPDTKFYFVDPVPKDYIGHFSEDKILPYLAEKPDCILFKKVNIHPVSYQLNMEKHFYLGMPGQKLFVFETLEKVLKENYPEYAETFEEFKNGICMYCCNAFIMPKDLFFEYSKFLFTILEKVDKLVDSTGFDITEMRFLGFIGEYLLSIFVMQKQKDKIFKTTELAGTFICKDYKTIKRKFLKYRLKSIFYIGKGKRRVLKKFLHFRRCMHK